MYTILHTFEKCLKIYKILDRSISFTNLCDMRTILKYCCQQIFLRGILWKYFVEAALYIETVVDIPPDIYKMFYIFYSNYLINVAYKNVYIYWFSYISIPIHWHTHIRLLGWPNIPYCSPIWTTKIYILLKMYIFRVTTI